MDTILSYLETMFAKLPKTEEIEQIKQELQMNMEEKYQELIAEGKTENEAIGTVIAEFGNIDELIEELGYSSLEPRQELKSLSDQEIEEFLQANKRAGKWTGIGVGLILFGVASLIFITSFTNSLNETNRFLDVAGLIPLITFVAIAVGIFMVSSHRMERYKMLFVNYQLTNTQDQQLKSSLSAFQPIYLRSHVIGVILCVLAPLVLILISAIDQNYAELGVTLLLMLVAVAVFLFIYYGQQKSAYEKLLKQEDYEECENKDGDRLVSAVAALIWPTAVALFLITGLVFHQWKINWIIFPVTGLLFAAFSGMRYALKEK